ncbi:hypothetical protein FBBAL38_11469 [Flavobacteria bacterium BAL38]|nr:hypothetical protein FBBAL38_11469 [Flavobacteria bacterium BAL38]
MTATTFAQAPEKMSYQAVIRNSSDALVANQAVGMRISILQTTANGTAVYVETQTPTTNINGLVSIEIGNGTPVTGTFAGIDWATGPYFIKTETDPTGSTTYTITGTSQLMSVPYALYAAKSGESAVLQAQITALQAQITALQNANVTPLPNVTIGTQIWSSTNLDVTTYRDGTPIPQVTDPTAWANLTTGAWCYYNNDPANGTIYGKLYNWYAVAGIYDAASLNDPSLRKQLAPQGWHVPSDAEWTTLTTFLGGVSEAGGKMKSTGTSLWLFPNLAATNESGFTGLPGGCRGSGGSFDYVGNDGIWWSSSESSTADAWNRGLNCNWGYAYRDSYNKRNGFSVRCLRD